MDREKDDDREDDTAASEIHPIDPPVRDGKEYRLDRVKQETLRDLGESSDVPDTSSKDSKPNTKG